MVEWILFFGYIGVFLGVVFEGEVVFLIVI